MPSVKSTKTHVKPQLVLEHFDYLWQMLFTSPMHLDSALSKLPKNIKPILAQIVPVILQRPASIAHFLKLRTSDGEPWTLTKEEKAEWQTAHWMCERLYKALRRDPFFRLGAHAFIEDFPYEMNQAWKEQMGAAGARVMGALLTKEAPLSLRVSRRANRQEILSSLNDSKEFSVRASFSKLSPLGIIFPSYVPIMNTDAFKKGFIEIQDEGSQIMACFALWPELFLPLLTKQPGKFSKFQGKISLPTETPSWTVIDACAGAGGKTLALADAMQGRGQVFGYDIAEKKLAALKQRGKRSGWNNIKTVLVKEGKEIDTVGKFRKRADVVLVDAPCSGWGVLRRNPDIKWRQTPDVLERMPTLQLHLLETYSELTAKNGRLTFGVCTFRKEETADIVNQFLERNKQFRFIGGGYLGPSTCDGFFMASFTRIT